MVAIKTTKPYQQNKKNIYYILGDYKYVGNMIDGFYCKEF